MTDLLFELLNPHIDQRASSRGTLRNDAATAKYLNRISTLPLSSITDSEPESLRQTTRSNDISLQGLSARSNASIVSSSTHLSHLTEKLPTLAKAAEALRENVPNLDSEAVSFSEKYSRATENEVLDRRKKALLLARNVERLTDILDLPTLLSSTIASSTGLGASNANNHASALDLHSHIKRLHLLHKGSAIIGSIYNQTEEAMQEMTSNLIASLKSQNIKLAAGLRTVGWLKRIAPELDGSGQNNEGSFGALFLVCRLATLVSMLSALEPLRDLADQETALRLRDTKEGKSKLAKDAWSHGQQTERYLKRYVEIFREQSFSIVSMYKSIFPSQPDLPSKDSLTFKHNNAKSNPTRNYRDGLSVPSDPMNPLPPALSTFPLHLVNLLSSTLRLYLPNVRDKSSRESLLTQILYCAGSLGRLEADFSMLLPSLSAASGDEDSDDENDMEWINIMKKHRLLASKLERMASGGSKIDD